MAEFERSNNLLIKKVKEGNEEAKEIFFKENASYIQSKACIYTKKFSSISDDYEEYYSLLYESCLKAFEIYDETKGDFYHLWMVIAKREILRFVKRTVARKENIHKVAYDSLSDLANALTSIELSDYYEKNVEFLEDINNRDLYEKMIEFVDSNFKKVDKNIFLKWLEGYTFGELAKKHRLSYSCVASKVYNILNLLKYKFKD